MDNMDNNVQMNDIAEQKSERISAIKSVDFVSMFSHPLFLAICILWSVNIFVEILANYSYDNSVSLDVIGILFLIGLWISYGKAKSRVSPLTGMNMVSGTLKAIYIILWVVVGILIVCGLLMIGGAVVLGENMAGFIESAGIDVDSINASLGYELSVILFCVIFSAGFIGAAIIFMIVNVFYIGKVHLFAKSLCENEKCGENEIEKAKAAKNWLMVVGIFTAISAVFGESALGFISCGVQAATLIVSSCWIRKHFVK